MKEQIQVNPKGTPDTIHKLNDAPNKALRRLGLLVGLFSISLLLSTCRVQPSNPPVIIQGTAVPPLPTFDDTQIDRGENLYNQYCTSCHGVNLEGEEDWQRRKEDGSYPAPPLDSSGHAWHHTDEQLVEIMANWGDPALGATMTGFSEFMSHADILDVLTVVKDRLGLEEPQIQWWITAR